MKKPSYTEGFIFCISGLLIIDIRFQGYIFQGLTDL